MSSLALQSRMRDILEEIAESGRGSALVGGRRRKSSKKCYSKGYVSRLKKKGFDSAFEAESYKMQLGAIDQCRGELEKVSDELEKLKLQLAQGQTAKAQETVKELSKEVKKDIAQTEGVQVPQQSVKDAVKEVMAENAISKEDMKIPEVRDAVKQAVSEKVLEDISEGAPLPPPIGPASAAGLYGYGRRHKMAAKSSSWIKFVKKYMKEHGVSYKEALQEASDLYHGKKKRKMKRGKGISAGYFD